MEASAVPVGFASDSRVCGPVSVSPEDSDGVKQPTLVASLLPSACQLGDVMVDIASNIMLADERVLWLAQREAKACSRVVQCLQRIATHRLANGAHVYSTVSDMLF